MRCPFCDFGESKVIDSRPMEEGNSIRRRRECLNCAKRFTTYEVVEELSPVIIKKDGRVEKYDRNKILNGMLKACEKRPIALAAVDEAVNKVEREIRASMDKEISTIRIGEFVVKQLKELDQVAYIRFISVYNQFANVNNFMQEIKTLVASPDKPLDKLETVEAAEAAAAAEADEIVVRDASVDKNPPDTDDEPKA